MSWQDDAACRGATHLFFPDETAGRRGYRQAKAICAECPVVAECAEAGAGEIHGVWGGQSPRERQRLRANPGWSWSPRVRAAAEALIAKGHTDATVSRAVGVPLRTVLNWRRAMGDRRVGGRRVA